MTEQLKHECGIAMLRLLKPPQYYKKKYGTSNFGIKKLYLLMEKQHNRGQDGAGVVSLKMNLNPGEKYIFRERSNKSEPIKDVFEKINNRCIAENNVRPFSGELLLGHLRYGTFGKNNIENVHPVMRQNNWRSRNLIVAGNFNMTNVDELFGNLKKYGQHPIDYSDTVTVLENLGHFLDEENQGLFDLLKKRGHSNQEITKIIEQKIDIESVLSSSSKYWDGGYAIAGIIGHGDSFVLRDPSGIRPAFYYYNDEFVVVTSERPVIQTVFNIKAEEIKEVTPGNAVIIRKSGEIYEKEINKPQKYSACSFERIYFSRGTDKDIYTERKMLGELITPAVMKAIDDDIDNTVFSFIPNTAETSFYGMIKSVEDKINEFKKQEILKIGKNITEEQLTKILQKRARIEKIAVKDVKLRTFITQDNDRNDLVEHVYDITYGTINENKDNLVIIDDSIVRGTTLKQSVIKILDRLKPKSIIIVSSSPQIRYPDCYGIDMARLGDFIAFRAAIELLKETGQETIINDVYDKSKAQENKPKEEIVNFVKKIYKPFSAEEISNKIAQLVTDSSVNAKVKVIYQSIENLHKACKIHKGDWYFTGNYPTPGGNKVVNTSFINFYEGNKGRAY